MAPRQRTGNGEAVEAALEFVAVLDSLGIPYLIGGSLASSVWGEARFTQGVDIVTRLEAKHATPLVDALREGWYVDRVGVLDAIRRCASFNAIRLQDMVKVDVFVPPRTGFDEAKWRRGRKAELGDTGRALTVTCAEDILLQKLLWFHEGGGVSEQQWRDVTSLLRIRAGRLDDDSIEHWAGVLGLEDLLRRARDEAAPPGGE